MNLRHRVIAMLLLSTATLVAVVPAHGQTGDVEVVLDQFGVGSAYRPGSFVGIRVELTALAESALDEATTVWVQWDVPNVDGDIAEYGRPVTLTKRQPRRVWLYAPISPDAQPGSFWPVRVYDYRDGRRGKELGGLRVSPPTTGRVEITSGMIGVVGTSQVGLGQLGLNPVGGRGVVFTAMEETRCIFGLRPPDLPDRWEGLESFEAIAWSDALPQDLPLAQSEALREWVRRGGHLIIALPEDTNPWGLGELGKTDLEELLPSTAPRKDEDVPLSALLPIMSKARALDRVDFPLTIRVFRDSAAGFDAIDNHYDPLVALPDGRVVVVQRVFGFGRITVVGIDLSNRRLAALPLPNGMLTGLPQADVFWNRILGRRADTPSSGELQATDQVERLTRGTPTEAPVGVGALFRQQINMSGKAGKGLLMALLLFTSYWILAGPGGFYLLKHYRLMKHAWLAFAGAAAVFTAIAWAGVNVLRQNDISIQHVTFLDHIHRGDEDRGAFDPQLQRGVSWFSLYLPGYGDSMVEIDSLPADGSFTAQRDLLVCWTPPGGGVQSFPNAARYTIDLTRNPDDYLLPTRSTATQMYANWLGALDPQNWGNMIRVDPADPVRVEIDAAGNETLRGRVINDLPGPLTDVTLIWVWNKPILSRAYARSNNREAPWVQNTKSGHMLNVGRAWREATLGAGATYALPSPGSNANLYQSIHDRYVRPFEGNTNYAGTTGTIRADKQVQYMEMLSMYQQLTPPTYLKGEKANNPETMIARRMLGRELDLSAWFNRPCLIIMGVLENSPCPIPLRVNGEAVASSGRTIVRWIHPLPVDDAIAFPRAANDTSDEDSEDRTTAPGSS